MRNIRICQRNCIQNRSILAPNKKEALYQCLCDNDCDGNRLGPYPFDTVTRLALPSGCSRKFDQKVLGEGTILDEVTAEAYGVGPKSVQRFMTLCADCRYLTSESESPDDDQILHCALDPQPDKEWKELEPEEKTSLGCPGVFLTRPVPGNCRYRHEQQTILASVS